MAQIKKTCSVTNGSQTVTVAGDLTGRVKKNCMFLVVSELVPYTVAVDATYNSITNLTTVSLTGSYQGATNSAAPCVFATDFTYPTMIPTIAQGDVGTAAIFTQAMYAIQAALAALGAGGAAAAPTFKTITDDALNVGSLVYFKSTNHCGLASATAEGKEAVGISLTAVASGAQATIAFGGTVVSGLSGLTPGAFYYMGTLPGSFVMTANAPATLDNVVMKIGVALSASQLLFAPETPITL